MCLRLVCEGSLDCVIRTTKGQKELKVNDPALSGEWADRLIVRIKHHLKSALGDAYEMKIIIFKRKLTKNEHFVSEDGRNIYVEFSASLPITCSKRSGTI